MSPLVFCTRCAGPLEESGECRACSAQSSAPSLVSQAEALFVSYLAARIVHARQRLQAAQEDSRGDPRSRAKTETLRRAEEEVLRLQNQLVAETRERQRELRAAEQQRFLVEHRDATAAAVAAPPSVRRCPRCAGELPGAVQHCRCGYAVEPHVPAAAGHALAEADTPRLTKDVKGK